MNMERISVEIEGDYLSSFIYSGVLILVDSNFFLHAYSWDDVVSAALRGVGAAERFSIASYFNNSSCKKIPKIGRGRQYFVNEQMLSDCYVCSTKIGVWPSDINIYKNRIYISSDEGVDIVDFAWIRGQVASFCDSVKLWKESAFSISANDYFRLAIASGKSGVLSFVPKNREVSEHYLSQIISSTCVDCDWQNEHLIANTVNDGVNVIEFKSIPKRAEFNGSSTEYWNAVNLVKREQPAVYGIGRVGGVRIVRSWLAGEKLFYVTDEMDIGFVLQSEIDKIENVGAISSRRIEHEDRLVSSRTASFGTVIEFGDSLKVLGREDIYGLDNEFATWRVFPRSKNYANQLHVIRDRHISILAVEPSESEQARDGYGFSVESLNE